MTICRDGACTVTTIKINSMKHLKAFFAAFLLFCLCVPAAVAQNTSTQGKEFWVSFLGNGFKTRYDSWTELPVFTWLRIQLIVSAKRDCNCTISNPNTNYLQTFHVNANSTYLFDDIPWDEAYMELEEHGQILNKGLRITADDTISVYCANIAEVSFDASFILPAPALGDDYIIQTYDQSTGSRPYSNYYTSAFLIVATEEGETTVDITPTVNTLDGHNANNEYSITLYQGEAYQVRSHYNYGNRDLSGTRVTARDCKKIAVFNGNNLTKVPNDGADSDCIFEQAMPLSAWGKKFVVTASLGRGYNDLVKITSAHNDNAILKDGQRFITLDAGQSITFELPQSDRSCFIEASSSCAVYLYNHSADLIGWETGDGAPSMVWIAPIEQRINDITFSTFNYESEHDTHIDNHYVNIIVSSEDVQHVYLDGELLSPLLFEVMSGTSEYRFARKQIDHGSHHLSCANGFNAHVYGFGHAKGYAYLVGSNAINLNSSLTLNDEPILPNESFPYCSDKPITFHAEVNLPNYELLWDFGDGTTSTDNPVTHSFSEARPYNVSVLITTHEGGCTGSESNITEFVVDATQQYIIEHDDICSGEIYSGYGFNNIRIENDTILARTQDNPIHGECQDSVLVYIDAHPQYHIPIDDSRCWQGEPGVYDAYGFSFEYDRPGTYDRQLYLATTNGCDSILNLHLTVADRITYEFNHHECGSSYIWDGQAYNIPDDYERHYISLGGCDSIVTLHLTMGHPQYTTFDTISCGVFEWNGLEYDHSGTFQQVFTTFDGCDSIVDCTLLLSGNVTGTTIEVEECNEYEWFGESYTLSGQYEKTLSTVLGCDSTVYLNLDMEYTPDPTPIYPADTNNHAPHWVVTATEFQINSYDFVLWDNNNQCHWDSVTWSFEDPSVQWVLEPDSTTNPAGKRCRIYVLNQLEDTVWLKATVYNKCHSEGTERRYWFVCSFFGMDENYPSPGLGNFSVVPNPNNGQMTLNFEHLTGKIDIKVYDMRGILVDHLQTFGTSERHSLPYQCASRGNGIYCFIATSKEGTMVRKAVIVH